MNKESPGHFFRGPLLVVLILAIIVAFAAYVVGPYADKVDQLREGELFQNRDGVVELNEDDPYTAPEIAGIESWINSDPLTMESLRGKVVLIDFWTYSCINCIRTLPHIVEWDSKYRDDGLVIIGVHSPEFEFEKDRANVVAAMAEYEIEYPVAQDNDFTTWRAYNNRFWPAKYFIDRDGNVRHTHFGEGAYSESEAIIRLLLEENGQVIADEMGDDSADTPPISIGQTPETYLGYRRGERLRTAVPVQADTAREYTLVDDLRNNEWSLGGLWEIKDELSHASADGAQLTMDVSGKDVYLVMGAENGGTVEVRIDGELVSAVGATGTDVNEDGVAAVQDFDLYELVEFDQFRTNARLELTFSEGVRIHAFTFGS